MITQLTSSELPATLPCRSGSSTLIDNRFGISLAVTRPNALQYFDEIACGVLRREQRLSRSGGAGNQTTIANRPAQSGSSEIDQPRCACLFACRGYVVLAEQPDRREAGLRQQHRKRNLPLAVALQCEQARRNYLRILLQHKLHRILQSKWNRLSRLNGLRLRRSLFTHNGSEEQRADDRHWSVGPGRCVRPTAHVSISSGRSMRRRSIGVKV